MRKSFYLVTIILSGVFVSSCQTGLVPASRREMAGGIEKPGTVYGHGRETNPSPARPELYVKRKTLKIEPQAVENTTGSLMRLDDQRNYLYLNRAPFAVGQFVDVKVVPTRSEQAQTPAGVAAAPKDESSGDAAVKEMLASLPHLDPGTENGPKLITNMKMAISQVFDNGDVLVTLTRNSQKDGQGNEISISARIPAMTLMSTSGVSTANLVDVHWHESEKGQLAERYSSGWEDEYSLRLSGFDEAKSKYAQALEEKRNQLENVKDKLKNQLVSLGKERQTLAKEREKLAQEKAKNEEQMDVLAREVDKQRAMIEEQTSEITNQKEKITEMKLAVDGKDEGTALDAGTSYKSDEQKTQQKPGDSKDGSKGKK